MRFAEDRPETFELLFRHDRLEGAGAGLRDVSLPLLDSWVARFRAERPEGTTEEALAAWVAVHGIASLSARGALRLVGADPDRLIIAALHRFGGCASASASAG